MDPRPPRIHSPMREGDGFHLPLHLRQDHESGNNYRKKFPESLHLPSGSLRMRSRTASTRSSISSAHIPDSATSYSHSTLASPLSSSYASDIQERFACHNLDGSRPPSRIRHRHRPSIATCSTLINDDEESPVYVGYNDAEVDMKESDGRMSRAMKSRGYDPAHEFPLRYPSPSIDRSWSGGIAKEDTPMKEEDDVRTPGNGIEWDQYQTPCESPTRKSEISFSAFGETIPPEDADGILDYTLQLVYGIDLSEAHAPDGALHHVVSKFVRELGQHIWQAPSDVNVSNSTSASSSTTTPSNGGAADGSHGFGKRKKQPNGGDGGEELSDGEGSGCIPSKRFKPGPKEEENLRLSCPYRKRNPHRFNVRDHHSCAMTYFPKFAELRQHIVKQHKRDDPSAFVCDRCTRDFLTRKELRDHQRQPKEQMCDISDHDPEAGIDGPTSNKLLSRKRVSGASPEVQWKEIWNILFPDDDDNLVHSYHYTPVIEHFELSAHYLEAFNYLQSSLGDKISNPATLETLATKFHHCFIETMERCVLSAQSMPYANRSNKRNEPSRVQSAHGYISRKPRVATSRPDSGVVIDDTSEESGSIVGFSSLGHRDSVRTVTSHGPRRESNLVPKGNMDSLPPLVTASTSRPLDPSGQLQAITPAVDMNAMSGSTVAAVEAWANGLAFNQHSNGFGLPDHWISESSMTPQEQFAGLDDQVLYNDFCAIDETFTNIHSTKTDGTR